MGDGEKSKAGTVALSEVFDSVIEIFKQLKDSLFPTGESKGLGIASSFQKLPCTFDICLTKEDGKKEETTRVKRELKQILKKSEEEYQTYVNVEIEHCVKSAKWKSRLWQIVPLCVVSVALCLVIVGAVAVADRFMTPKQEMQISHSAVQLLKGKTNLVQKVEMSAKCEGVRK